LASPLTPNGLAPTPTNIVISVGASPSTSTSSSSLKSIQGTPTSGALETVGTGRLPPEPVDSKELLVPGTSSSSHSSSSKRSSPEVKSSHELDPVRFFASREKQKTGDRACHQCGKIGHIKRDCPSRARRNEPQPRDEVDLQLKREAQEKLGREDAAKELAQAKAADALLKAIDADFTDALIALSGKTFVIRTGGFQPADRDLDDVALAGLFGLINSTGAAKLAQGVIEAAVDFIVNSATSTARKVRVKAREFSESIGNLAARSSEILRRWNFRLDSMLDNEPLIAPEVVRDDMMEIEPEEVPMEVADLRPPPPSFSLTLPVESVVRALTDGMRVNDEDAKKAERELGNEATVKLTREDHGLPNAPPLRDNQVGTALRRTAHTIITEVPMLTHHVGVLSVLINPCIHWVAGSNYKPGDFMLSLTCEGVNPATELNVVDRRSSVGRFAPPIWTNMTATFRIEGSFIRSVTYWARRWYSILHGSHGLERVELNSPERVTVSLPLLYELLRCESLGVTVKELGAVFESRSRQLESTVSLSLFADPFIRINTVRVAQMLAAWQRTVRVENILSLDFLLGGGDLKLR